MFTNLTGKQKTFAVILIILCLVAIVLAIYFGVSKRCPPVTPIKPSFKSFKASSTTNPWQTPTYYTYSYVNAAGEGNQSVPSAKVQSDTQTNPIIKVDTNSSYSIKIYRAVGTPTGEYNLLTVTVNADGTFTDNDNPYIPPALPPTPTKPPVFQSWAVKYM